MKRKEQVLAEFREIPGVGESIAGDLWELGLRSLSDLCGKDPEKLYREHCRQKGTLVDRCMLYVLRCAVYYASHERHDPDMLKWWNWSDEKLRKKGEVVKA